MAKSHNLGFPRIGNKRQLKFALEAYWKKELEADALFQTAEEVKQQAYAYQQGLDFIPVGDFSLYDHVLDTSALLGVIPERFGQKENRPVSLDTYFRVARGQAPTGENTYASEMTKWFDTNYHFIVPEITKDREFSIATDKLFEEIKRAKDSGLSVKPVLLGPLTWLYLAKVKGEDFEKLDLLPSLTDIYLKILQKIKALGISWLQIDEPILVLDLEKKWQEALISTYQKLNDVPLNLLLTTYFGDLGENLPLLQSLPVEGLHIDGVVGQDLQRIKKYWPKEKVLSVGIVNGRNIWANDLRKSLNTLKPLADFYGENLWVAPSCSLLHVPVDLQSEDRLDNEIQSWLAFAAQKIIEVTTLVKGLNQGEEAIAEALNYSDQIVKSKETSPRIHKPEVVSRVAALEEKDANRPASYKERAVTQKTAFNFPLFPTTTIGSFPQTSDIRLLRRDLRTGKIDNTAYTKGIKSQIKFAIEEQEKLGIDVLVHGEAERNDMVEYFGEHLDGFAFTRFGWVQSYGSRYVKPPIIYGDVKRSKPITLEWIQYAQSLTSKPVKGMLTGPVTILAWSFPREDETDTHIAYQIALALRDEVTDLEDAGIHIIQIDEPAFREILPLKKSQQADYLSWAAKAFRLSSSGVANSTQIHTHMCYSEFNEIIEAIANLDADVITIETSRSEMELLDVFRDFKYPNEIGPGVYDIHSPNIPTEKEITTLIEKAIQRLPKEKIWVNPDCGLKTRGWQETRLALQNLMKATHDLRRKYH